MYSQNFDCLNQSKFWTDENLNLEKFQVDRVEDEDRLDFEHVQATLRSKPSVPKLVIVLLVREFLVHCRSSVLIVDQLRRWTYHRVGRGAVKCRDRNPFSVAVHHGSMQHTLVPIVANNLIKIQTSTNIKQINEVKQQKYLTLMKLLISYETTHTHKQNET